MDVSRSHLRTTTRTALFLATLAICAASPQGESALERGQKAFARSDFAEAERLFIEAAALNPRSARAHKWLGMVFAAKENYEAALEPFRTACGLDENEENACYYLGRAYYSLSRFNEAKTLFEKEVRRTKEAGRPLLGLAQTLEALGDAGGAEYRYKQAIAAGEKRALVDYGLFLHKNGRGKESIEILQKADAPEELARIMKSVGAAGTASGPATVPAVRFELLPLDMVVRNGATGSKHLIETMIAGVALFDYDNDGLLDVFVANGGSSPGLRKTEAGYYNRLFRNAGGRRFEDVTQRAGLAGQGYCMGVAAADFDNDGRTDLFVTGVGGNSLYRNAGDGTFADVTGKAGVAGDGSWSVAAGWFDYDSDGLLDLFVVHYVDWQPSRETRCEAGYGGIRSYCHPRYYAPLSNELFHNMGDGTFRNVSAESGIAAQRGKGMGVAFGDYDLDGRPDIFVGNDTVPNFLFHNDGDGHFRELAAEAGVAYNVHATAISSMGTDFRDYDNDGREDLFLSALTNETFPLFRNLGNGLFADVAGPAHLSAASMPWGGWGAGVFDFNNDGWKDIFTANGHAVDNVDLISSRSARQPNTVFMNRQDGTFEASVVPGEALHRGCAFGDIDGDGDMDVVVTRLNEAPVVLWNTSAAAGKWIRFHLRGTRSNRDGIGALIEIETPDGKQWNRVTTCVGYGGSSEVTVHFGLGAASGISRGTVRWPSGFVQPLGALRGERTHEIREPDSGVLPLIGKVRRRPRRAQG